MEYVKVVLKWKWMIIGLFVAAVVVAGLVTSLMPKAYKVSTSLEIGEMRGPLEPPAQVVEKITSVYGAEAGSRIDFSGKKYPEIKAENPEDTQLVKIEAESSEPEKAREILRTINGIIIEEHREKFQESVEETEEEIEEIQDELTLIETQKIYTEGISDLQIRVSNLKNVLNRAEETKVVKEPLVHESPVGPNTKLNVAVAGVLALFSGVFIAFFAEWWKENA